MAEYKINYKLNVFGDRNKVRMAVVDELSKEQPGQSKGDLASRYTYYVETLSDGNRKSPSAFSDFKWNQEFAYITAKSDKLQKAF